MAQRTLNLDRHGADSGVTRSCPDKEIYGRFELDMASHLDITLPTVPGPRAAPDAQAGAGEPAPDRTEA
ncbi:hypothetical protein [Streptomyces sp. NPDC050428]|uniref:hypothetical protein n=1 Tax=Streptomyces sp. NPDC050428 TaxID=3155757 RepID=UPI00342C5E96